jgi:hypothetical protein
MWLVGCSDQPTGQSGVAAPSPVRGTPFRKPAADASAAPEDDARAEPSPDAEPESPKPDITPAPVSPAPPAVSAETKLPGSPDKDKPEYLRVSFNELASFDYDAFEADVPQEGPGEGGATVASTAAAANPPEVNGAQPTAGSARRSGLNWQIPEPILALNGRKVVVQGFMVPIEIRKDEVKSFLLVRNQMVCCFGVMVGFNEWIFVQMEGAKRAKFVPDTLVSVYGMLEVGEDVQNGLVMSIFRLEGHDTVFQSGF